MMGLALSYAHPFCEIGKSGSPPQASFDKKRPELLDRYRARRKVSPLASAISLAKPYVVLAGPAVLNTFPNGS